MKKETSAQVEPINEIVNEVINKSDLAKEVRTQAANLLGHRAEIVPSGTIEWVKGWVKTTQVDLRPKTPCVLVVVEGDDGKLYRRVYGHKLLKVDLESPIREPKVRVHVPETLEELEAALKKAQAALDSATNKVNFLTKALEEAKKSKEVEA